MVIVYIFLRQDIDTRKNMILWECLDGIGLQLHLRSTTPHIFLCGLIQVAVRLATGGAMWHNLSDPYMNDIMN